MTLNGDWMIDRRRLKRRLGAWRVAAIVALVAAGAVAAGRSGLPVGPLAGKDHVARISINGLILDEAWRRQVIGDIAKNDHAKALIVRINSPGGTVVGGEEIFHALRAVAAQKPVVAVMGSTATSAAYMAAIATDRIFARAGSVTGSIGVILQAADMTAMLEKIGITPHVVKSGPLKAQPNPMEPFTEAARKAALVMVLDLYGLFVDMVSERRKLPRDDVLRLADGRVFSGRQALAARLIDELGGEEAARAWLEREKNVPGTLAAKDVKAADEGGWLQRLEDLLGSHSLVPERLRLDGLIALWHPGGY